MRWLPVVFVVVAVVVMVCTLTAPVTALNGPLGGFFPSHPPHRHHSTAGTPLYLTPYIQEGKLAQARKLAHVTGLETDVESYAGLLTTNATTASNMFFWFFPAKNQASDAATVLWLQGGPGGSALFGLFVENGPFSVDADGVLHPRNFSWHNTHNMLYIDNPVGTGYSYTSDSDGYADNEEDVARDLYSALYQFFTLFKQYRNSPFFVTGESYAGKYIPAIGYKIHQENPTAKMKINLQGLAIGDGLCDPINQVNYGEFLYQLGLISVQDRDAFKRESEVIRAYIQEGKYEDALNGLDMQMSRYTGITGLSFVYNYLLQETPNDFTYYPDFVTSPAVRSSIHVGNLQYHNGHQVYLHLEEDMMHSIAGKIEALLDANYRILFYNGMMDVIIDYVGTQTMVKKLTWSGKQAFNLADRTRWHVEKDIAGYVRQWGPLTQLMVRNAGHILPYDQPKWAFDMISRFISGKEFSP